MHGNRMEVAIFLHSDILESLHRTMYNNSQNLHSEPAPINLARLLKYYNDVLFGRV